MSRACGINKRKSFGNVVFRIKRRRSDERRRDDDCREREKDKEKRVHESRKKTNE